MMHSILLTKLRISHVINKIRTQLVQNAASILRSPVQLLPKTVQKRALLEALKNVFKEALEDGDFEFLEDKWLKVSIKDMGLSWCISYKNEQLVVADKEVAEDVSFSGNLNDLVLIAGRKEDPDTLFFQRRLSIEGAVPDSARAMLAAQVFIRIILFLSFLEGYGTKWPHKRLQSVLMELPRQYSREF